MPRRFLIDVELEDKEEAAGSSLTWVMMKFAKAWAMYQGDNVKFEVTDLTMDELPVTEDGDDPAYD